MSLVDVCDLDSLSNLKCTCIRCLLTHDQTEQSCLAGTVWTDYTNYTALRQREAQVLEQLLLTECFGETLYIYNLGTETRTVGYKDFKALLTLLLILIEQSVIAIETGFTLGLTGLGSHAHPFELAFQSLAAF